MVKEDNISGVAKIVMLFIMAIIGVILLNIIADAIFPTINLNPVSNESLDVSSAVLPNSGQSMDNEVGLSLGHDNWSLSELRAFNGTIFVEDTDYIVNTTLSLIYMQNTTVTVYNTNISNTTYADYTWTPNEYIQSSSARVLMGLIVLFFAIGLLLFLVGMVWKELKDVFD